MIGKAYISIFQFYDKNQNRMNYKKRPVLIIGKADDSDYVILPISSVSNRSKLNPVYDYPISPLTVPSMGLKVASYIRTHKQAVVHKGSLTKEIINFKKEYPDDYKKVLLKVEEFQKELIANAIK